MRGFERRLLTREQKMGVILLFAFSALTIGLGFLQLRNTIYGPFALRPKKNNVGLFVDEQIRLQSIDTDQDGLNDFEELKFYETSPYIPDTDSDGIRDKEELDRGTDPLCPEGRLCETREAVSEVSRGVIASPLLDDVPETGELFGSVLGNPGATSSVASVDLLLEDPALLRTLLLQTGKFTEDDLNKFTDEDLLQIAKRILAEQGT